MGNAKAVKKRKWLWIYAAVLALILAIATGCTGRQAQVEDELDWEAEFNQLAGADEAERAGAGESPANENEESSRTDPNAGLDPAMIVAKVNGIDITAGAVMEGIDWAMEIVFWENIETLSGEANLNADTLLEDGTTFGRAVLETAANMAAHLMLYEDYAARYGITIVPNPMEHWAFQVIDFIISDPEKFMPFEDYMPECDGAFAIALEKAEELLARVLAGEDFDMLMKTYGEDPGMEQFPDGYTFVSGDMVTEFEEATLELEIGEISGLVISQFGVHIIKRVEPIPENIFRGPVPDDPDELMAAKHILVMGADTTHARMTEAILIGFEGKLELADIELYPELDKIYVGFG